ncbi:MAG: helix-turn-helix domain-containing protein [Candidatus Berkelbacteria bacterium]
MPKINLEQFGMSSEEAKVYLALVKRGSSGVMDISHESNLSRSTTYYHLEALLSKGLVSQSFNGKKHIYTPSKPKVLERILEQKELELADQKQSLPSLLKRIENIAAQQATDPEAQILKGKIGLLQILDSVLGASGDIYFIGSHDVVLKNESLFSTEFFLRNFTAKRRQKGKSVAWIIGDESEITLRQKREQDTEFRKIKVWSELANMNGGLIVYGSKVLFYSVSGEATAYIIHNPVTSEILKVMFKMIWSSLE